MIVAGWPGWALVLAVFPPQDTQEATLEHDGDTAP